MKINKKYLSVYGAKKAIRADQYLVELIIQRRAERQKVILPPRFWSNPLFKTWTQIFGSELRHSKSLFDKYDAECIIEAYQSHECKNILSSTNKQFEPVIQEFQRRKNLLESTQEKIEIVTHSTESVPNKSSGQKSKLGKLK